MTSTLIRRTIVTFAVLAGLMVLGWSLGTSNASEARSQPSSAHAPSPVRPLLKTLLTSDKNLPAPAGEQVRQDRPQAQTEEGWPIPEGMSWQDGALVSASALEQSGDLGRLFARWYGEETDEASTDQILEGLAKRLSEEQINPSSGYVRCTESVCRARFEFDGLDQLQKLARLKAPEGARTLVVPVEQVDGQYRVAIYWKTSSDEDVPAEVAAVFPPH